MSWLFSQVLVEEYSAALCLDGEQSALLSGNPTQQAYCAPDKMTVFSRLSRFGMTFKPLTVSHGEDLLTLFLEDSRAKTSQPLEKAQELTENEAECGDRWRGSFTKYDPNMSLWRTHQCSLLGDLEPFSETWPQWGLMRNGECWEQQTLAHPTKETVFGFYVPTPTSSDGTSGAVIGKNDQFYPTRDGKPRKINQKGNDGAIGLGRLVLMWPTPRTKGMCGGSGAWQHLKANTTIEEARLMGAGNGGKLNPTWVEWLMGWPLGWTDLKPLETDKSHCAPQQHGDS